MGCYDSRDATSNMQRQEAAKETKKRLDVATRLLCRTLRMIEDGSDYDWPSGSIDIDLDDETAEWWDEHKELDAERLRIEAKEILAAEEAAYQKLTENRKRKRALSKLTEQERMLLGLEEEEEKTKG
jgi:hypothetical protein